MLNRYLATTFAAEKNRCLLALAATQKPYLIQATLNLILNGVIRSQDMATLLSAVGSNPYGRSAAWEFLKEHYDEIYSIFGSGNFSLGSIVSGVTQFSDSYHLEDIKNFFTLNPSPAAESAIAQALERIQLRIDWLSQYGTQVCNYLSTNAIY